MTLYEFGILRTAYNLMTPEEKTQAAELAIRGDTDTRSAVNLWYLAFGVLRREQKKNEAAWRKR